MWPGNKGRSRTKMPECFTTAAYTRWQRRGRYSVEVNAILVILGISLEVRDVRWK
jgi:hypothetical protein